MTTPFKFAVKFQVRHPTLTSDAICEAFAMKPKYRWNVGDPMVTPKNIKLGGIRKETYCTFDIGSGADGRLAECLQGSVSSLKAHAAFLRSIDETGGSCLFYVYWYPNGDTGALFDADLLNSLAELKIQLGINVFDDRPEATV